MAFIRCDNVRIAGVAACVPRKKVCNLDNASISREYDAAAFVESTGILERRVDDYTTSDLCKEAAERLLSDLGWERESIDALVFVSQTTDYYLPATACVLQDRLGLSRECFAQDIVLGCSGWVYGLSNVASMLSHGDMHRALLLCGDARRHVPSDNPLFGYAGSATALEFSEGAESLKFHFGTDGSGYDAVIIPDGGCRNQVNHSSFEMEEVDGHQYNRLQTRVNGMDVFSFGIRTAPKSIRKLAEHFDFDFNAADWYIFHQANRKLNDKIVEKLGLKPEKVPSSLLHFGNTSSASIPLTIVTCLKNRCTGVQKFICCGFGVGLSWGTVAFETNNLHISELVEI